VDGQNVAIEYRLADGSDEQYASLAAELIALPVDVIVTVAAPATYAAIAATSTTPIVAGRGARCLEAGLGSAAWGGQATT
jgi:putative ABC transport system substrate-binding protein